jgi:threonine/homoserine/homoserine lactone efflux protein
MEPIFFLKGLIIGFGMAVPIGPVGILCIRKTLADGHSRGLIIGLGAATADSLFGSIAAFGLTFVSDVIVSQHFWLRLVGGGILLFLGIRTFRAKRKDPVIPYENKGMLGSYLSAFLLVLTNPVTIFAFVAVFAAFGLGHKLFIVSACILVLGVFTGSGLWFLILSYVATTFRKKLDSDGLRWVNRIAGILIILSGAAALVSLI